MGSSPSHTIMALLQLLLPRINNLRVLLGQNEGKIPQIAGSFVKDGLVDVIGNEGAVEEDRGGVTR